MDITTSRIEALALTLALKGTSRFLGVQTPPNWGTKTNAYSATLHYQGRQLTTRYYMGMALTEAPTPAEVLETLAADASLLLDAQNPQELAENLGMELEESADVRKAYKLYDEMERQTNRLRTFLGEDFEAIVYGA